ALGMLTCHRRGLEFLNDHFAHQYRKPFKSLFDLPDEDPETYEMLSRADSVGVFQVESRAQMSMLPRLKPKEYYDLVIEVAIVRPGPIQGNMVHPYLKRRDGIEDILYPSPGPAYPANELKEVLKRTLGVPLFQEQAMQIAITAAGFSPDDADRLRRSMATFRNNGTVSTCRDPFVNGMTARGYDRDFAERCFSQIEGFGEYGFPESHAASFALLVYASAWIKCHHPDVFLAAILNSQPMGFYQPAQLVRDAREHGVEIRPVDVNSSAWDCTLEPLSTEACAVRLGFRQVDGLKEDEIKDKLIAQRGNGYSSLEQLARRGGVTRFTLERLAEADGFTSMGLDRRSALWAMRRLGRLDIEPVKRDGVALDSNLPLFAPHIEDGLFDEPAVALPAMQLSEEVVDDYQTTGLSLKAHPCSFFRPELKRLGAITSQEHRSASLKQDAHVTVAGLVLMRQMPGTAKGVVFITLEDETGIANIIVWPKILAANRRVVMTGEFLAIRGRLQRAGLVIHVVAESFIDLSVELRRLRQDGLVEADLPALIKSRDFH
ncbi:MAG: OB-fold nucleic acid binding domain-containing protein, partial [Parvibaculaceae bacterium]